MALPDQDEQAKQDAHFIANSLAEALVPASPRLSIKDLFESEEHGQEDNVQSILPWVEQRDVLFLDEDVPALIVLKTPLLGEEHLKALLKRVSVGVELCATGIGPSSKANETRSQQVKDVLSETTIDASEEPFVVASQQEESEEDAFLFVIWKAHLPFNRPRLKFQKLCAYLVPSVTLKPVEIVRTLQPEDQLLPSMVPRPINLLQSFEFDVRFRDQLPRLSASRITKVAPAAPALRDGAQRLRTAPRHLFRAGPALFWRIRFSKTTGPPKTRFMFATLEFEVPQLWQCDVSVINVELKLDQGEVYMMGPDMPMVLRAGDQHTVLFRLAASSTSVMEQSSVDQLDICITAAARLSETCSPTLNIKWTTKADFAFDQHAKPTSDATALQAPVDQNFGPDSLPYSKEGNLEKPITPVGPTGVTVAITGPDRIVVGKPFKWEVFVVNRSDREQHFAVFPLSKPSATQHRRPFPPAITPLRPANQNFGESNDVYDMPISWFFEPTDLTCLSSTAKTGPLTASACGTTELKFLAVAPGVLHVEAVRVVDLATRKTWDIKDLPDIIATVD